MNASPELADGEGEAGGAIDAAGPVVPGGPGVHCREHGRFGVHDVLGVWNADVRTEGADCPSPQHIQRGSGRGVFIVGLRKHTPSRYMICRAWGVVFLFNSRTLSFSGWTE